MKNKWEWEETEANKRSGGRLSHSHKGSLAMEAVDHSG